jgi:ribonuclease D
LSAALITDNAELARLCAELANAELCALDTEFVWRNTYKPRLGLIQVAALDGPAFLVDPLAVSDFSPLSELLKSPGCLKILHACSQDLPILDEHLAMPLPLLDTQIAAAFCGYPFQMSYAKLAQACLGEEPDKSAQRSNWLRRPLTERQLRYATRDVTALIEIHQVLKSQLCDNARMEWALAESADFAVTTIESLTRPNYLKVKGYGRCTPRELLVLQRLADWRDSTAQRRDCPLRWVLDDASMLSLARNQPSSRTQLSRLRDVQQKSLSRYGNELLQVVEAAQKVSDSELPARDRRRAPSSREKERMEDLSKRVDAVADDTGLAREMLLSRQQLTELVRNPDAANSALTGWRAELLGDLLA